MVLNCYIAITSSKDTQEHAFDNQFYVKARIYLTEVMHQTVSVLSVDVINYALLSKSCCIKLIA